MSTRRRLARCIAPAAALLAVGLGGGAPASARPTRASAVPPWLAAAKPAPWMRLGEDRDLGLLQPFRDPKGPAPSWYGSYRAGTWSLWRHRLWFNLATERSDAPARPYDDDSWMAWRTEAPVAAPFRAEAPHAHWFVKATTASPAALPTDELRLADRWLPPWMKRVDHEWATELLDVAACGRGGACSLDAAFPAEAFLRLWRALAPANRLTAGKPCVDRPVLLHRIDGESDSLVLVRCDGALADDALVRLSVLARPRGVAAPTDLPDEPDPKAERGEWVPGIRLVDPRLVWVISRLADHFKGHAIEIASGYRPATAPTTKTRGARPSHGRHHASGRALDVSIHGVSNEDLLAACHAIPDIGCGYYPRGRFVHVDVRPVGTGSALWVDASAPGERSVYLRDWPGVVERQRVVWSESTL